MPKGQTSLCDSKTSHFPEEFWRLMRLYLSQNMISSVVWARDLGETDLQIAIENAQLVLDWYDDLKEVVPNWYHR